MVKISPRRKKDWGPAEFANFDRRLALPPWRKNSLPAPVVVAAMGGSRSVFSVPCSAPSLLRVSASPREPSSRWPGFPRSRKIRPRPKPQGPSPRGEIFATAEARTTGIEPATFGSTVRRYAPIAQDRSGCVRWSGGPGAIPGPNDARGGKRRGRFPPRAGPGERRRPINPSRR